MKSATIPPLRVTPDLRRAAEGVLRHGESLSSFVEESLRQQIERRKLQSEFIARGLLARDEARAANDYLGQREVMDSLEAILASKRRKA